LVVWMCSRISCSPPLWLSGKVSELAVVAHWVCSVRPRTWKSSSGAVHCSWRIRADYLNPLHHSVLVRPVLAHTMGQEGRRSVPWCERGFGMGWWFTADAKPANQTDQVRFLCDGGGLGVSGRLPLVCLNAAFLLQATKIHQTLEYRHRRIRKRGL